MKPHEALELQAKLREAMNDDLWIAAMDQFIANMDAKRFAGPDAKGADLVGTKLEDRFRGQGPMWVATEKLLLAKSSTFIVEDRMNPLVRVSAADLPDEFVVEEHMVPSNFGFLVWQEPWETTDVTGRLMRTRAVTWRVGQIADADKFEETGEIERAPHRAVIVHEYTDMTDMKDSFNKELYDQYKPRDYDEYVRRLGRLHVHHRFIIVLGQPMNKGLANIPATWNDTQIQSAVGPIRAMIALWNLMGQKITSTEKAEFQPKTEKRWHRRGIPADVSVINLRRRSLTTKGDHEASKIDWQGQWRVRGHWHPYRVGPGRQEVSWRYVSEYLKGPDDKPLIERPKVYRLTR